MTFEHKLGAALLLLGVIVSATADEAVPATVASVESERIQKSPEWGPYLSKLYGLISVSLRYPKESMLAHEEGTAAVRVRLVRNGAILAVDIVKATPYPRLDDAARNLFLRLARLPPVPAQLHPEAKTFEFTMPIAYSLKLPGKADKPVEGGS